jgi:hypothetical protein
VTYLDVPTRSSRFSGKKHWLEAVYEADIAP